MSLNRWVFKWRLKVRMFSYNGMSAGREFQVDGAATKKARRASSVCMRGTTSVGASEERRVQGGAWVCTSSLRYVGVAVVPRLWQTTLARLFWARCSLSKVAEAGLKQVCSWLGACFRHAHASLRPGLQPGLQLARIMECGLYWTPSTTGSAGDSWSSAWQIHIRLVACGNCV